MSQELDSILMIQLDTISLWRWSESSDDSNWQIFFFCTDHTDLDESADV